MMGDDAAGRMHGARGRGPAEAVDISQALELRREHPEWFGAEADYAPVDVEGAKRDHVIAYLRGDDVVTVVPRLTVRLEGAWKDTIVVLPKGRWRNRLTGELVAGGVIAMKLLLKDFPVALLAREGRDEAMHEFTVWAPNAKKVAVKIGEKTYPMDGPKTVGGGASR